MKRIVETLILFCITMGFSQGEKLFQKGNTLYGEEKYQEAIDVYKSVVKEGKESASLYYNLGNAYYKLNDIGPSIFYYEKALALAPGDEDIQNNLAFAQKSTIDVIDVIPEGFVSKNVKRLTNIFSIDGWAWFSVICMLLFVILFIVYYVTGSSAKKRLFFIGSLIMFILGVFGISLAFKQDNFMQNNRFAIIFAEEADIKSEPNLRSEKVFELHEGTKVQVLETISDWKKIKLADGKIGWIPGTDLREL